MTATGQTFVGLDDDVFGTGRSVNAFTMRNVNRNLNGMTAGLMQPAMSRCLEVADSSNVERHGLRVNAPDGIWTEAVRQRLVEIPPGVTSAYLLIRANLASGETLYLYPVTDAQPVTADLSNASTGVLTCAGAGAATHYGGRSATYGGPFTIPFRPGANRFRTFAMLAQTTGFTIDTFGEVYDVNQYGSIVPKVGGDFDFEATDLTTFTQSFLDRDDRWGTFYAQREVANAQYYDDSGTTYTALTGLATHTVPAGGEAIFPATMGTSDICYVGQTEPFDGIYGYVLTSGAWTSITLTAQYYNGSTWATLSEWDVASTSAPGHNSFVVTKPEYRASTWYPPSDWAVTSVNSSDSLFFMRYFVTALSGFSTTPKLTTLRTLHRKQRWMRLTGIEETGDGRIHFDSPFSPPLSAAGASSTAGLRDVFVTGYSTLARIHAIHVQPAPIAGIT